MRRNKAPLIDLGFGKAAAWMGRVLGKKKPRKRQGPPAHTASRTEVVEPATRGVRIGVDRIPGKPSKKRKPRTKEAERKAQLAREAAAARPAPDLTPPKRWFEGLERMRRHLSIHRETTLRAESPSKQPKLRGTPWALVARFGGWDGTFHYEDLYTGIERTERDKKITKAIGARRLARLVVQYEGVEERGGHRIVKRDWTLAEIGPWDTVLSRALERLDPEIEDSITNKYDTGEFPTIVHALFVWISVDEASPVPL